MTMQTKKVARQFRCTPAQAAATGKKVNQYTEIELRIKAATTGTAPKSAAKNKALATVKWVLKEACGFYVGMKNLQTVLVKKSESTVFDGRDNEAMKLKYFTALTGGSFTIELL